MSEDFFKNFVVYFQQDKFFVPIRIQIIEDRIVFIAEPGKGESLEKEALAIIEKMQGYLTENNIKHEAMTRNIDNSFNDAVDMIAIRFK